ncbi:carboxypeptidase-like regulatory domain-containing protein [Tamlana sp. 2201CG12-4]|uniref:carboxypeptidase-like regulatory domain-containing protein n=1 Tax=Tamlana sp. 2201CG12-4 TaxID=3112582 RepID=UPI002DBEDBCA|nr:carboxypeptidase-like regulatory domain-containing protein [Tamlana sp. 2201CG12-4]MEC3905711.1 carboxypeptidase-like regulatory domain-containing protein [Tamlana sp. 2201CG12-4]
MRKILKCMFCFCVLSLCSNLNAQGQKLEIEGIIIDESGEPLPYVSVVILSENIGTSSNDEGYFYFSVAQGLKSETVTISSIGYKTQEFSVAKLASVATNKIVMEEAVSELDAVALESIKADLVVKKALQSLEQNTVNKLHQLKVLYRRASSEGGKAKFLIEQYANLYDNGLTKPVTSLEIVESRQSEDYRSLFVKQNGHALSVMTKLNPLRYPKRVLSFEYKQIGASVFNNEDVRIIKGTKEGDKSIILYIGTDTYKVYKVETSARNLKGTYIFRENSKGKLYLSYHTRVFNAMQKLPPEKLKQMQKQGFKGKRMKVSYLHEAFILGINMERKRFKVKDYGHANADMTDIKMPYNKAFWETLPMPLDTKLFKKIKRELQDNYGVPLEEQYQAVNK